MLRRSRKALSAGRHPQRGWRLCALWRTHARPRGTRVERVGEFWPMLANDPLAEPVHRSRRSSGVHKQDSRVLFSGSGSPGAPTIGHRALASWGPQPGLIPPDPTIFGVDGYPRRSRCHPRCADVCDWQAFPMIDGSTGRRSVHRPRPATSSAARVSATDEGRPRPRHQPLYGRSEGHVGRHTFVQGEDHRTSDPVCGRAIFRQRQDVHQHGEPTRERLRLHGPRDVLLLAGHCRWRRRRDLDDEDNCPSVVNPGQGDSDGDDLGDAVQARLHRARVGLRQLMTQATRAMLATDGIVHRPGQETDSLPSLR